MAAVSIFTASSLSDKTTGGQDNWQDANSALAELDKGMVNVCLKIRRKFFDGK